MIYKEERITLILLDNQKMDSFNFDENDENQMFRYEIKIPKERIPVIIGKEGITKDHLETKTETSIDVDSQDGFVTLEGKDSLKLYTARRIVHAIARGFNPEIALKLLNIDTELEILNLQDMVGKSKKLIIKLRGRLIGTEGKSRKFIEDATECNISVYGKTVAIIGSVTKIHVARHAIELLIQGQQHSTVFKWLDRQQRTLKEMEFMNKDEFLKEEKN